MANLFKILTLATLVAFESPLLIGCGAEEPEKPKPVARAPKPKAKPKAKTVEQLTTELSFDKRIKLSEGDAPRKEPQRIAVLQFANALLNVDESYLKKVLPFEDQLELDAMIDAGLHPYMQGVSMVELKTGFSPDGRECLAMIFEVGLDYQVQLWYFEASGKGYKFSSAETQPHLVDQLSGDWVTGYFALKEKLIEIANQPDEETSYTLAGEMTTTDGSLDDGNGPPKPSGPDGPGNPLPGGPRGPGQGH